MSCCPAPIWCTQPDFYCSWTFAFFMFWDALPDERMGLSFSHTIHYHSWAQVPQNSWSHLIISFEDPPPQPGGPCPRIYITQEQGGPVIPLGTGFPFCCLLWLIGLWWSYSNPTLHRGNRNNLKLYCDWWSVGQSILVTSTPPPPHILINVRYLWFSSCGAPSLTREFQLAHIQGISFVFQFITLSSCNFMIHI
jgi:hypothetical protein